MAAKKKIYEIITLADARTNVAKARKTKATNKKESSDAEKKAKG
jgi:hypothetical protein